MAIDHNKVGSKFDVSFSFHIYFEGLVSFPLASLLNDFLWLKNRFMKLSSAVSRYTLFCVSGDNTVHLDIMSVTWHWPIRGHTDFTLQFVNNFFVVRFNHARHVLRARIAKLYSVSVENCAMFIRFWKGWFVKFKNRWAALVETFLLKVGLNRMILRKRFHFCFSFRFLFLSLSYSPIPFLFFFKIPVQHPCTNQ